MEIYLLTSILVCLSTAFEACESGWSPFDNSCYKYFTARKKWADAKTYCESQRGHLAIVMSNEENNFLKAQLRKEQIGGADQVWMDCNDLQTEGDFIWANTGKRLEITDWGPNEPNQNGGNEDCLTFFTLYDFKWNDEHCDKAFGFLCEIESSSAVVG